MNPKVSVVLSFYNGANFIRDTLRSVLDQTLADWELILIDDGSTDSSTAIAKDLASADERVRYATHDGGGNHGLAASRMRGSELAVGEHLLFLDHDDILDVDALERLSAILDSYPQAAAVFAGTRFWIWRGSGESKVTQSFARLRSGMFGGRRFLRHLITRDSFHPHVCSVMFRHGEFIAAQKTAPIWHGMYEDTALLVKLLTRHDIYVLNEPTSDYRIHANSMSHHDPRDYIGFLRWAAREIPMNSLSRATIHARRIFIVARHRIHKLRRAAR